jgi:hypothetical protein
MAFMLWAAFYQTAEPLLRDTMLAELPWWTEQVRLGLKWL